MIPRDLPMIAERFWTQSGCALDFPRPIEDAIPLALPATIVRLPAVNAGHVARCLFRYGIPARLPDDDRELMGCLVAHRGSGIIFLDERDALAEQRLTLAHEAAHLIVDYLRPRRDVIAAMGPCIADVLDGARPPTLAERASSLLAHVRTGPHVHVLARDGNEEDDAKVAAAESRADELAIELLAPQEHVIPYLQRAAAYGSNGCNTITIEMSAHFGVPAHVFARPLRDAARPRPRSFLDGVLADLRGGPR